MKITITREDFQKWGAIGGKKSRRTLTNKQARIMALQSASVWRKKKTPATKAVTQMPDAQSNMYYCDLAQMLSKTMGTGRKSAIGRKVSQIRPLSPLWKPSERQLGIDSSEMLSKKTPFWTVVIYPPPVFSVFGCGHYSAPVTRLDEQPSSRQPIFTARSAYSRSAKTARFSGALVPQLHETLEPDPELLLQPGARASIAAPVELASEVATHVTGALARAMRRRERAAPRPAKRAPGVMTARRPQPGGGRPRELERRQLVVCEKILGVSRATVPAGPALGPRPRAAGARFDRAEPCPKPLAQLSQLPSELHHSTARLAGTGLRR